jgi:hypothetical protein
MDCRGNDESFKCCVGANLLNNYDCNLQNGPKKLEYMFLLRLNSFVKYLASKARAYPSGANLKYSGASIQGWSHP